MGVLRGNPGDVLEDFTLENVNITLADEKFILGAVDKLVLKHVSVNGRPFVLPAMTE